MQRGDLVDNAGNAAGVTLNNNFFKHFECPELYEWFCECAYQFHTEVLGLQIQSKYLITDSWINTNTGTGGQSYHCLLYTSPSPRDKRQSRMPSSA